MSLCCSVDSHAPSVEVLLATFNGAPYITSLIKSLLDQTFDQFKVLIHDDGSVDGTLDIINKYCSLYPEKFECISDGVVYGSARDNFYHLIALSEADIIFFCDQDDIWEPDHVEDMVRVMFGESSPLLVFSDLIVISSQGSILSESMFSYQKLLPDLAKNYRNLLCHNVVTGCAMAVNRSALEVCEPFSNNAPMHDWWIALCVSRSGACRFLSKPTVRYRQHGSNNIGAKRFDLSYVLSRVSLKTFCSGYAVAKSMNIELGGFRLGVGEYAVRKAIIFIRKIFLYIVDSDR